MKKLFLLVITIATITALAAPTRKQLTLLKNDVASIRKNIKAGKELEKSEETVRKYLADSVYKTEEVRLQHLLCDVLKRAYEVGNEKMYLKQKTDTVCLLNTGRRMFLAYERLDTLDASVRHKNSAYLLPYRTNIFMGGIYFLHRGEWLSAWQQFDLYLQCPQQPLFSGERLATDDGAMRRVAFLSLTAAQRLDSLSLALKYADLATRSRQSEKAYEILSDMSLIHRDTLHAYQYLTEGFNAYSTSPYFFSHLVEYLRGRDRYDEALSICDKAVAVDSLNAQFATGKHIVLLDMQRYDESIKWGDRAIAICDSLDTPYYNIGYIYYQRAQEVLGKKGKPFRQRLRDAQKEYRRLLPYMQRYRALRPEDRKRWKPILYDTYLNLNMGKEFREISKL
ncbi:MAG: hypothetical protein IKO82_03085 [Prevotella sp.]|nr:hypothetical protein [Prevotella sp.]